MRHGGINKKKNVYETRHDHTGYNTPCSSSAYKFVSLDDSCRSKISNAGIKAETEQNLHERKNDGDEIKIPGASGL